MTLIKALEHLYDINAHMRAYAVIVDCLNENISAFCKQFGFELLSQEKNNNRLFLPMKTVKLLFGGK